VKHSASDLPTLHFRGVPPALDSLVAIAHHEVGPAPRLSIEKLASAPLGIVALGAGERVTRLHTSISPSTPPGTYSGSAELAGKHYPVELHVESCARLSLSPRQLVLSARADERLRVVLTLANGGNVACLVGKTHAFGLYDEHGAERGVGALFRKTASAADSRVERLLEELAQGYGGLVRVQVDEGTGSIAPGEVRQLLLHLHMPACLKAGNTYTGTWPLENLRYYVKITASGDGK
jgi:hypothetical protein